MRRTAGALFVLFPLCLGSLTPTPARAAIATVISYQGFLRDSGGNPISGANNLSFSLFKAVSGGVALWTEAQPSVPVSAGIFSVQLGSVTPFPDSVFANGSLWLQTSINGTALTPRSPLGATPFAFRAAIADSLVGGAGMRHFAVRFGSAITTGGTVSTPANCLAGEVATGGGQIATGASGGLVVLASSRPQPETAGAVPNGWRVTVRNGATVGTITVTPYVVCASP